MCEFVNLDVYLNDKTMIYMGGGDLSGFFEKRFLNVKQL